MSPSDPRVGPRPERYGLGGFSLPEYTPPRQLGDSGNGTVTLAVLGVKLDTLIESSQKAEAYSKACLTDLEKKHEADHDKLLALEGRVQRNAERIGVWQAGQATFTAVVGAIASWIGTR